MQIGRRLAKNSESEGIIPLIVRIGHLSLREWFEVLENIAVSVLLGTTLINRF